MLHVPNLQKEKLIFQLALRPKTNSYMIYFKLPKAELRWKDFVIKYTHFGLIFQYKKFLIH